MVRLEREQILEVRSKVGPLLARNPEDQVEVEALDARLPKHADRSRDLLRSGPPLEDVQQVRAEALGAERHTRHATLDQHSSLGRRDRLGVALDRDLCRRREGGEQAGQVDVGQDRRRASTDEHRLGLEAGAVDLGDDGIDISGPLVLVAGHGDEVAVAAPMRAERDVDVEVPGPGGRAHAAPSRLISSTARNASCGTSIEPTCFIRFLPAFCFSISFRLRETSPP